MKNFKNFNVMNESKWYESKWTWWLMFGGIIVNIWLKKNTKFTTTELKEMFKVESVIHYDWVQDAKDKVIDKIKNNDFKNKDIIIDKINKCKIIEFPEKMKSQYKTTEGAYINLETDFILMQHLNQRSDLDKLNTLTHELFHLVDHYRLMENKPNIKINRNYSSAEYSELYANMLGLEYSDDMDFDDLDYIEYLSTDEEIYARFNNLKLFLTKINFISNPNDDIPDYLWKSFFNGKFYDYLKTKEIKDEFLNSDFILILPFLKDSKLENLNKIAFLDKKIETTYYYA